MEVCRLDPTNPVPNDSYKLVTNGALAVGDTAVIDGRHTTISPGNIKWVKLMNGSGGKLKTTIVVYGAQLLRQRPNIKHS